MSTMAPSRPNNNPEKELLMVLTCPSMTTRAVFGNSSAVSCHDLLHIGRNRAEIAILGGGVKLDHGLNVVL